jgi:predicted nucleic acid-binding protein
VTIPADAGEGGLLPHTDVEFALDGSAVRIRPVASQGKGSHGERLIAMKRAIEQSRLVIDSIVYAEISIGWPSIEEFNAALPKDVLHCEEIGFAAAFLAGKCFAAYRRRGGTKPPPLPDFFIGAHTAVRGYPLLTRDVARYRSYFPHLEIIAPNA